MEEAVYVKTEIKKILSNMEHKVSLKKNKKLYENKQKHFRTIESIYCINPLKMINRSMKNQYINLKSKTKK